VALRFNMPAFMLKFVSSVIVILAISMPYLKKQWPTIRRRFAAVSAGSGTLQSGEAVGKAFAETYETTNEVGGMGKEAGKDA